MTTPRIGFCCKWIDPDNSLDKNTRLLSETSMNQRGTTLTALRKLTAAEQLRRIVEITESNIATLWSQLKWLANQPSEMRLFRISSDFIPASTAVGFESIMADSSIHVALCGLNGIREYADQHGIRLCTHPGQFTNISSDNPDVVDRAIEDLNYHGKLARYMGYGEIWHSSGFAINIHANVRQDPGLTRFQDVVLNRVSPEVRNLITLENDEFGAGVDAILKSDIGNHVALVLDIHHHWIQSQGEYIQPDDSRCLEIAQSWRGVRPLGHFSTSHEDCLVDHDPLVLPDFKALFSAGKKPGKLRAHSYLCWNTAVNDWALSHLTWVDLEVEAKGKNLASKGLYERYDKTRA
jgi:UV DNA damage endonuclease